MICLIHRGLKVRTPSGKVLTALRRLSAVAWVWSYPDGEEVELSAAFILGKCEAVSQAPEFVPQRADANPYGLSKGQARALDAMIEFGTTKDAAIALGLSNKTVEVHMGAIRTKMGATTIQAAVLWDRYRRSDAA